MNYKKSYSVINYSLNKKRAPHQMLSSRLNNYLVGWGTLS